MPLEIHKLLSVLLMGQSLIIMLTSCGHSNSASSSLVNTRILEALNISTLYPSSSDQSLTKWRGRHHLRDSAQGDSSLDHLSVRSGEVRVNFLNYNLLQSSSNRKIFRRATRESFSDGWFNRLSSDSNINWKNLETHSNIDMPATAVPVTYQLTGRNSQKSETKKWSKGETSEIKWPNKRVVSVEGDVVIGGLMMVHSRGNGSQTCGQIMGQGGVQALEVMLYTLHEINKNKSNPFTVGAHILDDCDTDTYGLAMALDFIKSESI